MTGTYKPRFDQVRAIRVQILKPEADFMPSDPTAIGGRGFILQDDDGALNGSIVDEETFNLFFELVPTEPASAPAPERSQKITIRTLIEEALREAGALESKEIIAAVLRVKPRTGDQVIHTELQRMKSEGIITSAKQPGGRNQWLLA